MRLSGCWRNKFTSDCMLCYTIITSITVLSSNFSNLKTERQYNSYRMTWSINVNHATSLMVNTI